MPGNGLIFDCAGCGLHLELLEGASFDDRGFWHYERRSCATCRTVTSTVVYDEDASATPRCSRCGGPLAPWPDWPEIDDRDKPDGGPCRACGLHVELSESGLHWD